MNEFTAKKLGEMLAFTDVGLESLSKGQKAFVSILGEEKITSLKEALVDQKDLIHAIADRAGVLKSVLEKFEKTEEKLRKMRDLYMGDEWDNPTELLEWSGFFEGAATVHASLLQGAATEIGHSELQSLADQVFTFHQNLLNQSIENLHLIGRQKASI